MVSRKCRTNQNVINISIYLKAWCLYVTCVTLHSPYCNFELDEDVGSILNCRGYLVVSSNKIKVWADSGAWVKKWDIYQKMTSSSFSVGPIFLVHKGIKLAYWLINSRNSNVTSVSRCFSLKVPDARKFAIQWEGLKIQENNLWNWLYYLGSYIFVTGRMKVAFSNWYVPEGNKIRHSIRKSWWQSVCLIGRICFVPRGPAKLTMQG